MALEPKAIQVLLLMVTNQGKLLEKAAILDAVWKNTFVEESTLTRIVALIRKHLGDNPKAPRFIETVPTLGYRFIALVEERGIDAEHLGDAQQHGDRQRTDVVLDLIQVAGGDVEHLSQRRLAESALTAQLSHPRSDEGLGHVSQRNNPAKAAFAFLAMRRSWQYFEL